MVGPPDPDQVGESATEVDSLPHRQAEPGTEWDRLACVGQAGLAKADSTRLALTTVAALEGALIVARAEQSTEPFDAVQRDLADLAKAAANRRARGAARGSH